MKKKLKMEYVILALSIWFALTAFWLYMEGMARYDAAVIIYKTMGECILYAPHVPYGG